MANRVSFSPAAEADLLGLYRYVAERSGLELAGAYVERVHRHCMGFDVFPQRGQRQDAIRPGLRTTGFERRVLIAFHIDPPGSVIIDRILYGGRDLASAFEEDQA
ncbi:MAG: plasmid stabilization system [Caulobacter sp.]|nr:plasmid stabilization system [Caulobacter sp.]